MVPGAKGIQEEGQEEGMRSCFVPMRAAFPSVKINYMFVNLSKIHSRSRAEQAITYVLFARVARTAQ